MPTDPMTNPQSRDDLAGKLKRTELQHVASSVPGREIVQVLTEIPAGVQSGGISIPAKRWATSSPGRCAWRSSKRPRSPSTPVTGS
jgi:hypothetical protein